MEVYILSMAQRANDRKTRDQGKQTKAHVEFVVYVFNSRTKGNYEILLCGRLQKRQLCSRRSGRIFSQEIIVFCGTCQ